jgi:hypothetical protein
MTGVVVPRPRPDWFRQPVEPFALWISDSQFKAGRTLICYRDQGPGGVCGVREVDRAASYYASVITGWQIHAQANGLAVIDDRAEIVEMSARAQGAPVAASEPVRLAGGEAAQALVPGVAPVSLAAREIAELEARRTAKRTCGDAPAGGLFDAVARAQLELF